MTEQVIIEFIPDFSKLETGLDQVAKTGKVDVKGFKDLQAAIDTTATDTQGLITQFKNVANASVKMGKSVEDAFGAGIQDALDQAGVSVKEFEGALKKAATPAASVKKELMALKNEMAKLKAEGKDTGKEFDALRARAGKLSDAIADANAEIKNAGSDTKNIDNVIGSISALAGGYAAVQGAAALFGEENEDLQKALLKVNGAMAIAQGIQQVSNALQKEGALLKLKDSIATGAQTVAQTIYSAAVGTSTGAMKAFRIALLATGIGAIIVLLGLAANALGLFGDKTDDAKEAQDALKRSIESVNESLDFQISRLGRLGTEELARLKSVGASQKEIVKTSKKLLEDEIDLSKLKEANLRKLAGLEKTGSEEQQALYKQANDEFYKQEDLKSKIKILGYDEDNRLRERDLANFKALNDKKKALLDAAIKEAERQAIETDKNTITRNLNRVLKEIEQEQIAYDNKADLDAQLYETKKQNALKWQAFLKGLIAGGVQGAKDAAAEQKKIDDEELARKIRNAQIGINLANQVAGVFNSIATAQTARDQQLISSQQKQLDAQIKAGAISVKAAESRQKQIDKFTARARQQQAEREKKAAVFQAVLAIPQAFLQGLASAPLPAGAIIGGIAAALAAAQAAIIASQPVPKFFRGKKDSYAGPGVVGDMGSEIVERDGRMFLYTKPTQTYLGAKDKVYTAGETKKILHNTSISTTIKPAPQEKFDYARFAKAIPANAVNINIDKDFITESVAKGLTQNKYMDRRYSSK